LIHRPTGSVSAPRLLEQGRIHAAEAPGGPVEDLHQLRLLVREDPVGHVERELDEEGEGQLARDLARGPAPHTVGHGHPVHGLLELARQAAFRQVR
jgi:hypothetical protein